MTSGGESSGEILSREGPAKGDPRRDDMAELLPKPWLRLVDQIGVDNFLLVWQTLSEDESLRDGYGRAHIRGFDAWVKLHRDRYIQALARRGDSAKQIQKKLLQEPLRMKLTLGHIRTLMKD